MVRLEQAINALGSLKGSMSLTNYNCDIAGTKNIIKMSRKNFKVATTEDGKTTIMKIDKTPTGKVKTIKDREKVRKEREEQYVKMRIGALTRRCKRKGISEEDTKKAIEKLKEQLSTPNSYVVLVFFNANDHDLVKAALQKEGLVSKIMSNSHFYIDADQETLGTLREIMPPTAKIHPYVKKKPNVLAGIEKKDAVEKPKEKKRTKAEKKALAAASKSARKALNMRMHHNHKFAAKIQNEKRKAEKDHILKGANCFRKRVNVLAMSKIKRREFKDQVKRIKAEWKEKYPKKATTVHLKPKKRSMASKKASTLKQAA